MATKRGGLGKGLDSLIPKSEVVKPAVKPVKEKKEDDKLEQMVKISKIEPNREQPRRHFEEDSLLELADSIKANGIFQNLTVVPYSAADHAALSIQNPDGSITAVKDRRKANKKYPS